MNAMEWHANSNERQASGQLANPRLLRQDLRSRRRSAFRLLCLLPVACCWASGVVASPVAAVVAHRADLLIMGKADEIQWRYEYPEARQEARKTGLPLMLYFAAAWSPQCKKMETTTLQDPVVVRYLNQHFIATKLDEKREQRLTERLKIQDFPTIYLAGPDGRIYDMLPAGPVETNALLSRLEKVVGLLADPEWMTKDQQEASLAAAKGDFVRAVKLLRPLADDKQLRPVQLEAQRLLHEIEQKAQSALTAAKQLETAGRTADAVESYQETARNFAGTPAASDAEQAATGLLGKPEIKLLLRQHHAVALLEQAKNDFRHQDWLCCVDRCLALTSSYADLPEGVEAAQLLELIKANPDWMKTLTETLADRLAEMYLATAETWIHKGEPQLGAPYLEKVVVAFPGTRYAEIAKLRLAQIQVRPTNPLKFLRSKFQGAKEVENRP